jgi:hypothetical protein
MHRSAEHSREPSSRSQHRKISSQRFPNGAATTCQVGDLKMTAGDAGKLLKATDFPFKSAKAVADIIVERAGL